MMPLPPQAQQTQSAPSQAPTPAQLPPPISNVADGSLPAIRFPAEKRNEASSSLSAFVAQNLDGIARAGVAFTELPDKQSVLFNATKTSKAAIHKAYKDGTLDKLIPEIKATPKPKTSLAPKHRTVHTAPVDLSAQAATPVDPDQAGGGTPTATPQSPLNSQNAPAGGAPGSSPHDPDSGPVKIDKKLRGARISALKNESLDGSKLPASVSDKLAKRAI